ncbi:BTB/POZ domain-containing protein NPY2-like isoform X2 [Solanum tuberosum]|uniref:BTB/POZ domain-containing protein NPY2-like isoform X2 n=1 Tax=Solanum tuberosum TaxID=4113 RepID=UPI00073A19C4|nr:PREDICTED: BTB/POZ domain-containing protein NPY2-like isoform X2 [Solanum tuberosum]
MKFMKLGSKPDTFQSDGKNVRYVASELDSDIVVSVGDVKFHLHKFPLLSKSAHLQKLVTNSSEGDGDEVHIHDVPGGPTAFEMCVKFCYGMTVTLNAYNVIAARCAAEYLGMDETVEKGNLIYKIDVFLHSTIFRSWKDSIIFLQTTKSRLHLCEEVKLISHCTDAIASKTSIDVRKVDWSYTYNRTKIQEENGSGPNSNGIRSRVVPNDWWVDDLCELEIDLYKRVMVNIKNKGIVSSEVIGEDSGEKVKAELVKRIGQQLEEASVNGLLIRATDGEATMYDVHVFHKILENFVVHNKDLKTQFEDGNEIPGVLSEASKLMVAKLVDGYLTEIAKDPNLPLSTFVGLAEMVTDFPRPSHDSLYRAIDIYLKEHPGISKNDRKRICCLMDCKKLSVDACTHAVQNERLPSRVVVQVLFFEQVRANASSGSSTPDLPKAIRNLTSASYASSRSATTNTENSEVTASAEELRALKEELAALRLANGGLNGDTKRHVDKAANGRMKSILSSKKIFTKIWSSKGRKQGENSGSDSSDSLEEAKYTPSRKGRYSVS